MQKLLIFLTVFALAACGGPANDADDPAQADGAGTGAAEVESPPSEAEQLASVLASQPDEVQARYPFRHPQETLEFFGVTPGMTVLEALPGRGWYTKVLLPYLGESGHLIGADYALDMWPRFGILSDEQLEAKKTWIDTWTADAQGWRGDGDAGVSAFVFGSMPEELEGTADAALFVRAFHNLARFEADGGYLTAALDNAFRALKPGSVLGVVQHEARPDMPDEWATGANGYLKKEALVARIEQAGFEFVGATDINANALDQPTEEDFVWRLSPTFATSRDNPELQATISEIGESNRMTLKFRKPM